MSVSRRLVTGGLLAGVALPAWAAREVLVSVRETGARGDGVALDTVAINAAIVEAARRGGTVVIPEGRYLCFSIRLASRVTLLFQSGAVLVAADPAVHAGRYDAPEVPADDTYQDFGHSHFHNSLIWGEGLEDVAIIGPGLIDGAGLTRNGPGARWTRAGSHPVSMQGVGSAEMTRLEPSRAAMIGVGNKAIALKACRRVTLRDFTVHRGGHFAILTTGVRGLTIEGLTIDTNRDGIDIDACRDVAVRRCRVNSPNDDAIVLKASYALGRREACRDVTISDCEVSGFDLGTLLDGTLRTTQLLAPDRDRPTGRIKIGTETTGDVRRVAIERCRFRHCRGLAIEMVDGATLEDVDARDLAMTDVTTAPLFLRLGDRRRGPPDTGVGRMRRVTIERVTATGIDPRYPATIAGLADAPVEDVVWRDIALGYAGGGTAADAVRTIPEAREAYPEPSQFGVLPAHGLYVRHARGVTIDGLSVTTATSDARPPAVFDDVRGVRLHRPAWTGTPRIAPGSEVAI